MSLSDLLIGKSLLVTLDKHPQERDMIGKLILAYGELEFMLLDMLRATLSYETEIEGGDTVTAVRVLYRLRSEANRLSVADALIRPKMQAQQLLAQYNEAHDAMFACKGIRNRYAHAQWQSVGGVLRVGDLDEAAKSKGAQARVRFRAVTLAHLKREWAYFDYADHALMYATNQFRIKTGQALPIGAVVPKPKRAPLPKLGNPQAQHSRQ